ncbi:MAG: DUF4038 domain-containing protein [Prevotellaceae bacterium]|nr:DUF4038 domain-containing protein [Prevotellaceae bacterium]
MKLSDNRRFLVTQDGKPFLWFGDMGWLLHKLNREVEVNMGKIKGDEVKDGNDRVLMLEKRYSQFSIQRPENEN